MKYPSQFLIISLIFSVFCIAIAIFSHIGTAATIEVNEDGSAEFTSIQAAIYSAENGDTIRVREGWYNETLVIDKPLTIIGDDRNTTRINGYTGYSPPSSSDDPDVVLITADHVTLMGFNITRTSGGGSDRRGIRFAANYSLVRDCLVTRYNRGILVHGDNNKLENIIIVSSGEGLRIESSRFFTMKNNSIGPEGNGNSLWITGDEEEMWTTHTIDPSNTIDGHPIIYHANEAGGRVEGEAARIILANCSGFTIDSASYTNNSGGGDNFIEMVYSNNCSLMKMNFSVSSYYFYPIRLTHCENIAIFNNWFGDNIYYPIWVDESRRLNIHNNTFSLGSYGTPIRLQNSNNNTIENNSFNRYYYSISLTNSHDNLIQNNLINNSQYYSAIHISSSNRNIIINNNLSNVVLGYSLYLSYSNETVLRYNNMTWRGIRITGDHISHWNSHDIDTSNILNNLSVIYLADLSGEVITEDAGQIIIANCSDIVVESQLINSTTSAITVAFSTSVRVVNCSINQNHDGIIFYRSQDCSVENSSLFYNSDKAIEILSCENILLFGNSIQGNDEGIVMDSSVNCSLFWNHLQANDKEGIILKGDDLEYWNTHTIDETNTIYAQPIYYYANTDDFHVPKNAGQVIIANCTRGLVKDAITANDVSGIRVAYSDYITLENNTCRGGEEGIYVYRCAVIEIIDNTCNSNHGDGIHVQESPDCVLKGNTCKQNSDDGITISLSNGTVIEGNRFENNHGNGVDMWTSHFVLIKDNICNSNQRGIFVRDSKNCEIVQNSCNNSDRDHGIMITNSQKMNVTGNTCNNNERAGNQLEDTHNSTLEENQCKFNRYNSGITLDDSNGNVIRDNHCTDHQHGTGIHLSNSNFNEIENNSCKDSTFGIRLVKFSSNNQIIRNLIQRNDIAGIDIGDYWDSTIGISSNNTVIENLLLDNDRGIWLSEADHNIIRRNDIRDGRTGIYIGSSHYNVIQWNNISTQTRSGLTMYGSQGNEIQNNTISQNQIGVQIYFGTHNNTFSNNAIFANIEYGIQVDPNASLIFNASGNWWGDPSGPRHPSSNFKGQGDLVSDNVTFKPWLKEWREGEDGPAQGLLYFLLFLFSILLVALVVVVIMPEENLGISNNAPPKNNVLNRIKGDAPPHPPLTTENVKRKQKTSRKTAQKLTSKSITGHMKMTKCEHCGSEYPEDSRTRSIRVNCPNCGRESVAEEFRGSEFSNSGIGGEQEED